MLQMNLTDFLPLYLSWSATHPSPLLIALAWQPTAGKHCTFQYLLPFVTRSLLQPHTHTHTALWALSAPSTRTMSQLHQSLQAVRELPCATKQAAKEQAERQCSGQGVDEVDRNR